MRTITWSMLAALVVLASATPAEAGCGCDKPPPPRATVRPFVGYEDLRITLFDDRLEDGRRYDVKFTSADGTSDWSRARGTTRKRDLADGVKRPQLRVRVPELSFGPCRITVFKMGFPLYTIPDSQFTIAARPIELHDFDEGTTRFGYQTGVGRDGTVYIPVDVARVDGATTFVGHADGFRLAYGAGNVAMYNDQGFLMQLLDPASVTSLFAIVPGDLTNSDVLAYWRHEFASYKASHRRNDNLDTDDDPDWHADGTRHVDHDHIVVAIRGMVDGHLPVPGATPEFELEVESTPSGS